MRKWRLFLVYWLPVLVWMAVIFTASSEQGSFQRSSRFLAPLFRAIFPKLTEDEIFVLVLAVRKCAHLSEYAVLALLVWRARRKPVRGDARPWRWAVAGEALWVAVFYATTDEFHQTFIPTREGCLRDVAIDSAGAAAGLMLLWLFGRWRNLWGTPQPGVSARVTG